MSRARAGLRVRVALRALAVVLSGVAVTQGAAVNGAEPPQTADHAPTFVGSAACVDCHADEAAAWHGSQHDLAMQEATEDTVLGDFDNASFTKDGVTSRFFRRDGKFFVNTDGPDGKLADFEVRYTFGVAPLQQYLIAFPDGRLQALGIAWDSRPEDQGGQRWFHLYPDEAIPHGDELHWTGMMQNWNFVCADCHSTNLRRNYDFAENRYDTTWSAIDVSCEACHGPGSDHVAWAANAGDPGWAADDPHKGLAVTFDKERRGDWDFASGAVTAHVTQPGSITHTEIETCAPCHSRRVPIADGYEIGKPLLDSYRLTLLTDPLYYADGQIRGEDYVYGSFLQSKMYHAGVTCTDCHDPHTLALKADGNDVCTQCHAPDHFDVAAHHFHEPGTPGAACVSCHAPETTYMVVDPRRDHSFRVPRPDLTVELGVPNACNGCHTDESAEWAAARIDDWYGKNRPPRPHFAEAFAAGRAGAPGATAKLAAIARDGDQAAIVRATAIDMLGRTGDREGLRAALDGLRSDDALIRLAAVQQLEALPPPDRLRAAFPLLQDPVRSVRLAAARVLAPVPPERLPAPQSRVLTQAFEEYVRSMHAMLDRPETLLTLGSFYLERGNVAEAETLLKTSIDRFPLFTPTYINLADVYRAEDHDADGEALLERARAVAPDDASVAYALGLLYVRQKRYADAEAELARAAELGPDNPRYGYVYALALQQTGKTAAARNVLTETLERHPYDRDLLYALATFSLQAGDGAAAEGYARRLLAVSPGDPRALSLLGHGGQ